MENTRLHGKDWLDAQRVDYQVITIPARLSPTKIMDMVHCRPEQVLEYEFYMGPKDPVIVVRSFSKKTNIKQLEKHVGMSPLRTGTNDECISHTGLSLYHLHPFLENYLWKVIDEQIFDEEKVYLYAGSEREILEVEANSLKYVIGVINGLLADVCEKK